MDQLISYLQAHSVAILGVIYVLATSAINALPPLTPNSSPAYSFWYRFLNALPIPTVTAIRTDAHPKEKETQHDRRQDDTPANT